MNDSNSESFAHLLDAVLSGDRSPQDPEVTALAETDERFRGELEGVLQMKDLLQRAGAAREEVLANLDQFEGAPGEDRIAETVQSFYAGESGVGPVSGSPKPAALTPRRILRLVGALAAAAVVLLLARPWIAPPAGDDPQRLVMGLTESAIRIQVGGEAKPTEEYQLAWEHPGAALGTTYVVVLYETLEDGRVELHRTRRLRQSPWIPDTTERELLSSCDALQIEALDVDGATIFEEASAVVSRSELPLSD